MNVNNVLLVLQAIVLVQLFVRLVLLIHFQFPIEQLAILVPMEVLRHQMVHRIVYHAMRELIGPIMVTVFLAPMVLFTVKQEHWLVFLAPLVTIVRPYHIIQQQQQDMELYN